MLKFLNFLFFIFLLLASTFNQAKACDLCSLYSSNQNLGGFKKGFHFGLSEQVTHFGTLREDGQNVGNTAHQSMDSSITQLVFGYHFNNRLGTQLNLPIIERTFQRVENGAPVSGNEAGIGDLSLTGQWIPFHLKKGNFGFSWRVLGGIKLPSGSTDRIREELSENEEDSSAPVNAVHGHDLTLGSGSVDGLLGTDVFMQWRRSLLTIDIQYSLRTRGDFGYRFADDIHWSVGPGTFLLLKHEYTFLVQAIVSGEHKGMDNLRGVKAEDTGITTLYLGPKFSLTWKKILSANLGADIPVSIDNTALQLVPDYRIYGSLTWQL